MKRLLGLAIFFAVVPASDAAIVCREASTGKLLEAQSPGEPGLCRRNWIVENPQYGYHEGEVEEAVIAASEIPTLVEHANQGDLRMIKKRQLQASVKSKLNALGFSPDEIEALIE